MKISLDTKEIEDAISLWLERKLMGGATYDVTVKKASSIASKEGDGTTVTIEAEATPVTSGEDSIKISTGLDQQ